jgi:hypothetical protein
MQTSLHDIEAEEIEDFFKHICLAINEHKQNEEAKKDLEMQIKKIREAPKRWILEKEIKGLDEKFDRVLATEKKLSDYRDYDKLVKHLMNKISFLEGQLGRVKKERDAALSENRKRISEIKDYIKHIRSRMEIFLKAKEERDRRLEELENKVDRVVK